MSNQGVSTLFTNTATRQGTCIAPLCSRAPRDASHGSTAKARTQGMIVSEAGEHLAIQPLPTPPKPITTARTSEFGYKEYTLLLHVLSKSWSGRRPPVQCGGGSSKETARHLSHAQGQYLGLHSYFTQPQNDRPKCPLNKAVKPDRYLVETLSYKLYSNKHTARADTVKLCKYYYCIYMT